MHLKSRNVLLGNSDQNSVFQQSIKKHGLNWFFIDWVFLCVCLCVETIIFWLPFKWFDGRWRNERFFVCFLWWKTLSYSLTGGNMSPVNSFAIQSNSSLVEYYEITMFETLKIVLKLFLLKLKLFHSKLKLFQLKWFITEWM